MNEIDLTYYEKLAVTNTTPIAKVEVEDQRKLPINYPQMGGERDMATGCKVNGVYKDDSGNLTCKWGAESRGDARCKYHRFGIMCDKLLSTDGKEIN